MRIATVVGTRPQLIKLAALQPDAAGYKELCRAKACGETWAHPALSDGRVFVRDDKELVALKVAP